MNNDTVMINGSYIDRVFFEENLVEARLAKWALASIAKNDHQHCIVCMVSMNDSWQSVYESQGRYLCAYCFNQYVARHK